VTNATDRPTPPLAPEAEAVGDEALLQREGMSGSDTRLILNSYRALVRVLLPFTTREDRAQIRAAFQFALRAHGDGRRKSGEPYILHPLSVARILVRDVGLHDTTAVCCALLHDVVEDTFAELADIERYFGPEAARIIDGLTKIAGVFDASASKQAENFRKMLLTMSDDIRVVLIKLADRLHNMRTLAHTKPETQLKIAAETQSLYAPLAHRLGLYPVKTELEDLAMQYTEPEHYRTVADKVAAGKAQRATFLLQFMKPIRPKLDLLGVDTEVKSRLKGVRSIWDKMKRQGVSFEEVYDVFAVRIILEMPPTATLEEEKVACWRTFSAVCGTYRPHPERTRDWISAPRPSGYESLHTTVMGPHGRWVEVQIRTRRMDYLAEKGLAAHYRYKPGPGNTSGATAPPESREPKREAAFEYWLNNVRDLLENKQLSAVDLVSEFKSGLVSEEIYVFTPKGEMKVLPAGATALDFAYEIHTNLGHTCIGAKVNQKVVPFSHKLRNGDQVEVITSRKQEPKPEWLDFTVTTKAQNRIKEALKEQRKEVVTRGKKVFDWKLSHLGMREDHPLVKETLALLRIPDLNELYYRLGAGNINLSQVVEFINRRKTDYLEAAPELASEAQQFDEFLEKTLGVHADTLVIGGELAPAGYAVATCCHPVPGDRIVALAMPPSEGDPGGLVIHRTNCPTAIELMSSYGQRIVKAKWGESAGVEFLSGIRITGQDRFGMLGSLVRVITGQFKYYIRSITIESEDGMFEGTLRLYLSSTDEAERLMEALRKVQGVFRVVRLEA
jgi:GTP diphosphokinase / guanosine-3',5'-bis(diphosphate) 3'-diphosphatase